MLEEAKWQKHSIILLQNPRMLLVLELIQILPKNIQKCQMKFVKL